MAKMSEAGRRSARSQSEKRRSKNEKEFASLCEQRFKEVKVNEPMFEGWDADIVIEDLKIAVHWNGAWHYKKITEKHSVKQVQNRDKLKYAAIERCGYQNYVIKDMGKYDPDFVSEKFKMFEESVDRLLCTISAENI